ncbi:uncharacterized protein LACBIDRAFT_306595 [Laccaria bicolor S238N-H82]|uniref:Predicted protein n=1 Tax=Laccaria bicolor (strain S238N-H82 / ATCC MYA-4686) TaxID=486041 RepID=B0DNE0_LACBS|nr:uncharacterized protein LACBIDRAFT_306595 [Laccaria bicolor S238N-H82]EDR03852.1 predicted protein [Laccaria bicolor S238N-H82]|eukprot:XP_001885420.1 predicted protein [Laccaria bicolor S238N-H82]
MNSRGSYPVSLSGSAFFKVGLVCPGSFCPIDLFLAQQSSKVALFVCCLPFHWPFFRPRGFKVGLV